MDKNNITSVKIPAGAFCEAACMLRAVCPGGNGRGSAALCSLLVARTVGAS